MDIQTVFASGFAPGIFWLWYFYKRDALEAEPKSLIIRTFGFGMLAVVPVVVIEAPFPGPWAIFIVAPIVEETAKFLVVRFTVYPNHEFNEPMDGIVYAAAAALGFASLENAAYLFQAYTHPQKPTHGAIPFAAIEATLSVFVVRAVLSVPGHVLWSSLWGHALGRAKWDPYHYGSKSIAKGLMFAIICHALFNLLASTYLALGAILLVIIGWKLLNQQIAQDLAVSPFLSMRRKGAKGSDDYPSNGST